MSHPLTQLASAEASLIASIEAATERLNAVGTNALQDALDRLQAASLAASARLQAAGRAVEEIVNGVLSNAFAESDAIKAAIEPAPTVEPAPLPTFEEITQADPLPAPMDGIPDGEVDLREQPAFVGGHVEPASPFSLEARQHAADILNGHSTPDASASLLTATVAACSPVDHEPIPPAKTRRRGKGKRPHPSA